MAVGWRYLLTWQRWLTLAAITLLSGCLGGTQEPDPVVADFPIAYVKRPLSLDNQGRLVNPDARRVTGFQPGGDLFLRERASPSAAERNITARLTGGLGDVKDVEVSYDGKKLLFALHLPEIEGATPENQPSWNIWEYDITTDRLRRIISGNITAEAGQDIAPHYLPDGRIIFASTRQSQSGAVLLDEGKPQFAALDENNGEPATVLHVMSAYGSDIHQVSFNQSHDFDPTVLSSGEVVFSRWDRMGSSNAVNLYKMRPDGTELESYYGAHSHAGTVTGSTIQLLQAREMADGRLASLVRPFNGTQGGGDIVLIDSARYANASQPTWPNQFLTAAGQQSTTAGQIPSDNLPSPAGRFLSAYPLHDGSSRLLVSWSLCRVLISGASQPCTAERLADPLVEMAAPLYGVYIYDHQARTMLPVVVPQEGMVMSDVVSVEPRTTPPILPDKMVGGELSAALAAERVGILHIRSVYDMDGSDASPAGLASLSDPAKTTPDQRPARFLRLVKSVGIPQRLSNGQRVPGTAFGRSSQQRMREIIGYAPIEPDGSVMVKVPANVAITLEVLDKDGRRIDGRHQNWLQLKAGETVECSGCHNHASGKAHGRRDGRPPVNAGAQTSGMAFANTPPSWTALAGETMAQTRARISCYTDCAALRPRVDVVFSDVWTDPAVRVPAADFAYRYSDLATPRPVSDACVTQWSSTCRIVIHYPDHVHPLWGLNRQVLDANGAVVADHTCSTCHNSVNGAGNPQVPAAQLDLGDGASGEQPAHLKSYRELLFPDDQVELRDGVLQDVTVQVPSVDANGNPVFEVDINGNFVLDANGNPIQAMTTAPVPVTVALSTSGARSSLVFFNRFNAGASHAGWLSKAELRLLSEWLDIGAQYYNDPFRIPTN